MIVGVPKEIKRMENRVALLPAGVSILKAHGHTVLVEKGVDLAVDLAMSFTKKLGLKLLTIQGKSTQKQI